MEPAPWVEHATMGPDFAVLLGYFTLPNLILAV